MRALTPFRIWALALSLAVVGTLSTAAAQVNNNSGSVSDSAATSFSSTGNWFNFSNIEESNVKSTNRIIFPPNYKLDPSFIAPLPPIYVNEGWEIWVNPFFHSHGITDEMLERLRRPLLSQHVAVWAAAPESAEKVMPLRAYPRGEDIVELGYVQVEGRMDAPEEEAVMEAIYHARLETKTSHVLVLKRHKYVSTGSVISLGVVMNAYRAIGPNGLEDEKLISGGGGSGIGSSKAWVAKNPCFRVIAFNKAGDPPAPAPAPAPAAAAESAKPLPPAEYYVSKHVPIFFAFDESKIRPVYMERNNELAIEDVALAVKKAHADLLKKGEKIFFLGGADIRGPEGHNDTLGMERGKSVMMAVAALLKAQHGFTDADLRGLLRFGSLGARQPQFEEHHLNRRVDVVRGSDSIVEYAQLPPPPYTMKP